jgi:hypothetical protein
MATIAPGSLTQTISTPPITTKSLSVSGASVSKPLKVASTTPRIDVEPYYLALKTAIGDKDWITYKTAVALFTLGIGSCLQLGNSLVYVDHSTNVLLFKVGSTRKSSQIRSAPSFSVTLPANIYTISS